MIFVLKERFKYADMLSSGDHRNIKILLLSVAYEVTVFQSSSETFQGAFQRAFPDLADISVVRVNF